MVDEFLIQYALALRDVGIPHSACVVTIPWRLGGVSDLAESSRNYCITAQKLFSIVLSVDMCVSREAG